MKKKQIKPPLALRMVGWLFPKLEKVAPFLAKRWFVRVFFTPVRYKMPYGEVDAMKEASIHQLEFENKKVQYYKWGTGKPILFSHGWMGRGTQFRKFIPVFNQAGYQVISYDATGHGKSEGKKSHLMEFVGIIEKLHELEGPFEMIVGHSLGGVASMHAIHRGLPTDKLVMISSPTIADKIVGEFLLRLNASDVCKDYFEAYIMKKYGKPFSHYSASYIVQSLRPVDLLLIHDEDDPEVGIENPEAILSLYPSATLVKTQGLGHTRILKDEKVIEACLNYLKKEASSVEAINHSIG
ncbi:alpha/beta fold hydrolase [Fulvivirga ligni]|uniref:alpha/beta fold hydrolase n=1 Tax=Fulvivirga ligni TaxID=2904246 RepID=UPI001F1A377A|nr:alpha/beta hydrolase [Fulvivirga ligni]UII23052.1 alpha/beta hydrolase [Fulvivirga ligni]